MPLLLIALSFDCYCHNIIIIILPLLFLGNCITAPITAIIFVIIIHRNDGWLHGNAFCISDAVKLPISSVQKVSSPLSFCSNMPSEAIDISPDICTNCHFTYSFPCWCWLDSCQSSHIQYIDGLMQGYSNAIADALELLQSCTKPSIWRLWYQEQVSGAGIMITCHGFPLLAAKFW